MAELTPTTGRRVDLAQKTLGWLAISVMPVGLVLYVVVRSQGHEITALALAVLVTFFTLLVARIALVAFVRPDRRFVLLILLVSILIWGLAGGLVNAARLDGQVEFPAPGEWLFLVTYLGLTGYLMLDVDRRQDRPDRAWLDAAVVCGGSLCLASLILVLPVQAASGLTGGALLLALIYPLIDLVLALVVLGQAILSVRSDHVKSLMLGVGFVLWAAGDSRFALQVSARNYEFSAFSYLLWGVAFALIVGAACRPSHTVLRSVPRTFGTGVLLAAAAAALAVLVIRPDTTLAFYTLPPALITMVAVAGRLVLALRDANRANEAFLLSETDDLTKLPNRRAVRAWLADPELRAEPLALMMLDLDRFKDINDSLGHRAGDTVLTLIALRMRESVASDVRVARLGGDEFAVLLRTTDQLDLMEIARNVLAELAKPIEVDDIQISPSGSIGITVSTGPAETGSELLRRADVAMYQAKDTEVGVAIYDAELDEFSRARLQLAEELRRGIVQGQIEVWYQPQVDGATLEVSGVEALARWRHPTQGLLGPAAFLPAARRAGLMPQLSEQILKQAVEDVESWLADGIELTLSVNCAPPELLGPTFLPQLYTTLQSTDLPSEQLVLEITEESFLGDQQRTLEVLLELRAHGVQVSIDDYGTGFSSLTYLRNLPVQELKIDRTLIGGVATDDRTRSVVASTIGLAHALGVRIVAEGVENQVDLQALVDMGIDILQGYHLARPMPPDQLLAWLAARETLTSADASVGVTDPATQETR